MHFSVPYKFHTEVFAAPWRIFELVRMLACSEYFKTILFAMKCAFLVSVEKVGYLVRSEEYMEM